MPFSLALEESCVAHKEQRKRNKIVHNAFMTPTIAQRAYIYICGVHIAVIKKKHKERMWNILNVSVWSGQKISIYLFRAISIFCLLFFLASSSSSCSSLIFISSFCRLYIYDDCTHMNIESRVRENHTWFYSSIKF